VCGCGGTDRWCGTREMVAQMGFVGWMGGCGGIACDARLAVVKLIYLSSIAAEAVICFVGLVMESEC